MVVRPDDHPFETQRAGRIVVVEHGERFARTNGLSRYSALDPDVIWRGYRHVRTSLSPPRPSTHEDRNQDDDRQEPSAFHGAQYRKTMCEETFR
jgi:hypothetical protein